MQTLKITPLLVFGKYQIRFPNMSANAQTFTDTCGTIQTDEDGRRRVWTAVLILTQELKRGRIFPISYPSPKNLGTNAHQVAPFRTTWWAICLLWAFAEMLTRNDTSVERRLLLFMCLDVELASVDAGSGSKDALGDGGE